MKYMVSRYWLCLILLCFSGSLWGQAERADSMAKLKKAEGLEHFGDSCLENGNVNSALTALTKAKEIRKKTQGTENIVFANTLLKISYCYYVTENYLEAINYATTTKEIQKRIIGTDNRDYAKTLDYLALYNDKRCYYEEAIMEVKEALKIRKKIADFNHPDFVVFLGTLAQNQSRIGNITEAITLGQEAIDMQKKIEEKCPTYGVLLHNQSEFYYKIKKISEAIKLEIKALEIAKMVQGVEHANYVTSLFSLARYYSEEGNYYEAIKIGTEALNVQRKILGSNHPDYASSLHQLALYYSKIEDYTETARLEAEMFENQKKNYGTVLPDYIDILNSLVVYLINAGNYSEAIKWGTEAVEISKNHPNIHKISYAKALNNLARVYINLGNYNEAMKLESESLDILKEVLGTKHPDYLKSLGYIADFYSISGNYSEAIKWGLNVTDRIKRAVGTEHPDYASSLSDLANYYCYDNQYSKALKIGKEAMQIKKRILGPEDPRCAISLGNLAYYYFLLKNYSEALKIGKEALDIKGKTISKENRSYILLLDLLAQCNAELGCFDEALKLETEKMELVSSIIYNDFSKLSSPRKQSYWYELYKDFFSTFQFFVFRYPSPELISLLYNKVALLSKSVILNTDIEMRKMLLESHDSVLIDEYQRIALNYEIYKNQINLPIAERSIDTDSLKQVTQRIDDNIVLKASVYGDFMRKLRISWSDIQYSLGTNDIAIEFLNFPISNDSVMYIALTLRKEYETPKMTVLFEEKQLKEISDTLYYNCKDMTDLVWGPLLPELNGIKNIYFSPTGSLHNIGIEYLPGMEGFNLYRLSSTRELVANGEKTGRGKNAVLYGGLDYNASVETLSKKKSQTVLNYTFKEHADVRGLGLRGGKEPLKHTKIEVDKIGEELSRAKWVCLLDTATLGTEESFKSLSGRKINCLHISTHGFYYTKEEADNAQYKFMLLNDQMTTTAEDKALTRSGLILSGANHILAGDTLPDNVEDGILTAKEISDVDLRGLDLVVLSACQTGLGDISQGEGVFGLQRGFKKAGANTILMSLWEVNDEATQILMTQFYKNFVAGKSKRQSLQLAQNYLRMYKNEKGEQCYNEPKYWAAFILLDGIN